MRDFAPNIKPYAKAFAKRFGKSPIHLLEYQQKNLGPEN